MKIALLGYGKMGKTIEELAVKSGHSIVLKVDEHNASEISEIDLAAADVAMEFTTPDQAYNNIMMCFNANVPVVCGTTGWDKKLADAEKVCKEKGQAFFYSPNFSIGVNLFLQLNSYLAKLMDKQVQYDETLIHETHHNGKLDSPSGTAIALAKDIIENVERLDKWSNYEANENVDLGDVSNSELSIFSSREDEVPGTHIVKYFSDVDEIEIIHKAYSRQGFAAGALAAAEFIQHKKGMFTMKDLLKLS